MWVYGSTYAGTNQNTDSLPVPSTAQQWEEIRLHELGETGWGVMFGRKTTEVSLRIPFSVVISHTDAE